MAAQEDYRDNQGNELTAFKDDDDQNVTRNNLQVLLLDTKKITVGACLGKSSTTKSKSYAGMDNENGKLYYITEWNIKHSSLEARNLKVSEFIETIQMKVQNLIMLRHKNIISYEGVLCNQEKESVQVFLIQEFILGLNMCSISGGCFNWNVESVSAMTKGILEGLIYLHDNGVSHGNLSYSAVFLDNSGNIKISNYSVIPYLQEFTLGNSFKEDLFSLGSLLEFLIPTPHIEMLDFINECRIERTLPASSLLEHSFLNTTSQSRFDNEFETICEIGKGAFGKVLKVRNFLDNREYAIKQILYPSDDEQLFNKITREVKIISRLNHKNVVRYFNSWREMQTTSISELEDSEEEEISSSDTTSTVSKQNFVTQSECTGKNYSDSIVFEDSKGRVTRYDDNEVQDSRRKRDEKGDKSIVHRKNIILYIQMEYCDKSTLRTAIDSGLHKKKKLKQIFREIVRGLIYIHQQGMIHRDLKCENIFLHSRDQVKIGDFGLATINYPTLQNKNNRRNHSLQLPKLNNSGSHTGQIGTFFYCAPELTQNADRAKYNQKVDIYSLGIIFFEMCHSKFSTGMERAQTLTALRTPEIVIPKEMLDDESRKNEVKIIRWLLDHEPSKRPSSKELLKAYSNSLRPKKSKTQKHALATEVATLTTLTVWKRLMQISDLNLTK